MTFEVEVEGRFTVSREVEADDYDTARKIALDLVQSEQSLKDMELVIDGVFVG